MFDKVTGKILPLSKSPHFTTLGQWLLQNPSYEPVKPGTPQHQQIVSRNRNQTQSQPQTPTSTTAPHSPVKHQLSKNASAEDLFSNPVVIHTGATPPTAAKKTPGQGQHSGNSVRSNVSVKNTSSSSGVTKPTHTTSKSSPSVTSTSSKNLTPKPDAKKVVKRQVSEERPKSNSGVKVKTDQERSSVRNILKDTLKQRMKEFDHPSIPKMTDDEIMGFAKETEREMFLFFNKDTRDKYKTKYRSLKFNLSDVKNKTLLERICAKKLTPKQLVELPSAALASEELSKWREDENKHQLEIITKSELDALTQNKIVVKTHKGEEIIETKSAPVDLLVPVDDVESVIAKTVLSVEDPHSRYDLSRSISLNVSGGNVSSPLSSPSISSSTGKKSDSRHRSRSRSKSRGKDHHHHHHKSSSSSSKHKKSERHRSRSPKHHSSRDKDRKSREKSRDRNKSKKDDHKHRDRSKSREKDKSSGSSKPKEHKPKDVKELKRTETKVLDIQPDQQDVDLVGKILDSMGVHLEKPKAPNAKEEKKNEVKEASSMSVDLPEVSTDPINERPVEIEIYSGKMYMADVAKFDVTASIVSGNFDDISKFFTPQLDIVGRIEPHMVWDYLDKVKKMPGKEICIMRFSSSDEAAYVQFFTYLHTRQRYGVIKSASPRIKDFYVVPVEASRPLPKVLLPIVGPGFIEGGDHKPDLLLGVLLKISPEIKVSLIECSIVVKG